VIDLCHLFRQLFKQVKIIVQVIKKEATQGF
jgi:hypothetical protein